MAKNKAAAAAPTETKAPRRKETKRRQSLGVAEPGTPGEKHHRRMTLAEKMWSKHHKLPTAVWLRKMLSHLGPDKNNFVTGQK